MEVWVKFFKDGFFGYGEPGDFTYFSLAHLVPLAVLVLAVWLVWHYRDRLRAWRHEETLRFVTAFVLMLLDMSYYWRLLYVGSSAPTQQTLLLELPLQVCGWTCIATIFTITKKSRLLYQFCCYTCLTLCIFPLLTPSVIMTTGPSYYRYYQFWLEHMLPVISVLYMTFVHGFRPTVRGIPFTLGILSVLTALSLICNANIEGANYLFLAAGTADGGGSPMDFLIKIAPALWSRVVILFALAIALFFAIYGIFAGLQKLADRRAAQRQTASRENS